MFAASIVTVVHETTQQLRKAAESDVGFLARVVLLAVQDRYSRRRDGTLMRSTAAWSKMRLTRPRVDRRTASPT